MNKIIDRICSLLTVKSIVTIVLTMVFAFLTSTGRVTTEFLTIYTVIIGFYFGTQTTRERMFDASISGKDGGIG